MSAAQCGDKETHAINILSSLELADGQDMDVRWRILESPSPLPPQAPVKSSTKARAPVFRRVISSPLPALDLTGMEGPSEKRAVAAAPVTERSAQQTSPRRYWFKQTLDLPGEMGLERLNIQRDGRCLQEDRQNSELGAIDNNDKVISQLLQSWRGGRRESYTTPGSKHSRVASSSVQDNSSLFAKHVGKHTRWDSNDRRDAAFWKALAHADAPRGRVATSCNRLDERQSCLPTIESISNLKVLAPPIAWQMVLVLKLPASCVTPLPVCRCSHGARPSRATLHRLLPGGKPGSRLVACARRTRNRKERTTSSERMTRPQPKQIYWWEGSDKVIQACDHVVFPSEEVLTRFLHRTADHDEACAEEEFGARDGSGLVATRSSLPGSVMHQPVRTKRVFCADLLFSVGRECHILGQITVSDDPDTSVSYFRLTRFSHLGHRAGISGHCSGTRRAHHACVTIPLLLVTRFSLSVPKSPRQCAGGLHRTCIESGHSSACVGIGHA